MISRAVLSGKMHGITMTPGTANPGTGDCAFESVIFNNNERSCFEENFLLPINQYRRIWATDMANRTIDTEWNIYSKKQWHEGWQQMQIPGTYERGIFGDLMIPGIACGARKILLIFNTNFESSHDPLYAVDPRKFNVEPDTDIPIVLAYNQSHYESLIPKSESDIRRTVHLANSYLEGKYTLTRTDFLNLVERNNHVPKIYEDIMQKPLVNLYPSKQTSMLKPCENKSLNSDPQIEIKKHIGKFLRKRDSEKQSNDKEQEIKENDAVKIIEKSKLKEKHIEEEINLEEIDKSFNTMQGIENGPKVPNENKFQTTQLCCRLKNGKQTNIVREDDGKMQCPICNDFLKNIKLHFTRKIECGAQIDLDNFLNIIQEFEQLRKKAKNK